MLAKGKRHCCINMEYYVEQNKEIIYEPEFRDYELRLSDDERGTIQSLWYCPWCGVKLPSTLVKEWRNILKQEYSITDPWFKDADKIPEEFKTDEWWKKRGL